MIDGIKPREATVEEVTDFYRVVRDAYKAAHSVNPHPKKQRDRIKETSAALWNAQMAVKHLVLTDEGGSEWNTGDVMLLLIDVAGDVTRYALEILAFVEGKSPAKSLVDIYQHPMVKRLAHQMNLLEMWYRHRYNRNCWKEIFDGN